MQCLKWHISEHRTAHNLLTFAISTGIMVGSISYSSAKEYELKTDIVIDRLSSRSQAATYEVRLSAAWQGTLVDVVNMKYEVSNVRIHIRRVGLGYGVGTDTVFEKNFERSWRCAGTSIIPTWEGGYVLPGQGFVLPSGRLLLGEGDEVLFVLFDGERCELYSYDDSRWHQETHMRSLNTQAIEQEDGSIRLKEIDKPLGFAVCEPNERRRDALTAFYRNAFSAHDVYWSYALIKHSIFFGYPIRTEGLAGLKSGLIDGNQLYFVWKTSLNSQGSHEKSAGQDGKSIKQNLRHLRRRGKKRTCHGVEVL